MCIEAFGILGMRWMKSILPPRPGHSRLSAKENRVAHIIPLSREALKS